MNHCNDCRCIAFHLSLTTFTNLHQADLPFKSLFFFFFPFFFFPFYRTGFSKHHAVVYSSTSSALLHLGNVLVVSMIVLHVQWKLSQSDPSTVLTCLCVCGNMSVWVSSITLTLTPLSLSPWLMSSSGCGLVCGSSGAARSSRQARFVGLSLPACPLSLLHDFNLAPLQAPPPTPPSPVLVDDVKWSSLIRCHLDIS